MAIEHALTIEQALTPDDLSTMRMTPVPDVWPPIDCRPAVDLRSQPGGCTLADGSGGIDQPADGGPGGSGPGGSGPGRAG